MDNLTDNIFANACLINLEIHGWEGAKKLPKGKVQTESDPDYIRSTKVLVDPEYLEPMTKLAGEARNYLDPLKGSVVLPFPIKGLKFIPKECIQRVEDHLQELKAKYDTAADEFAGLFDYAMDKAAEHLGPNFNRGDYPRNIRARFDFTWRFIQIAPPGNGGGVLSPELYRREKEKFVSLMDETRRQCVEALRVEFAGCVGRMVERLSDPKNVFRDTLVGNFSDFFSTFKARNYFDDKDLADLVTEAEKVLNGIKPQELRENKNLRANIADQMKTVQKSFDERISSTIGADGRAKRTLDLD